MLKRTWVRTVEVRGEQTTLNRVLSICYASLLIYFRALPIQVHCNSSAVIAIFFHHHATGGIQTCDLLSHRDEQLAITATTAPHALDLFVIQQF